MGKITKKEKQAIKLGIIGCGAMGQEIAITASSKGIDVLFVDVTDERIERIFKSIEKQLDYLIDRWGMTESEKKAIISRIKGYLGYEVLKECKIVIEAVKTRKLTDNLELRREIFEKIEAVVSKDAVIASNASTRVIDDLSVVLEKPERAIGMHFLCPVFTNKIIEVNKSWKTSEEAYQLVLTFAKMLDKQVININGTPGNISTRIIVPMINEACDLLMEGVSTVQEIDQCMQLGFGMQLGPFTIADKIGLDKLLKWMEGLYTEYGEKKYKASPIIKRLVRAGLYGERDGEGFYKYGDGKKVSKSGSIYSLGRT